MLRRTSLSMSILVAAMLSAPALLLSPAARAAEPAAPAMQNALADELLKAASVKGGLYVVLGCGDGSLPAALGRDGKVLIHAWDADAAAAAKAREFIRAQGLYGKVSAEAGSLARLPYAEHLANLVVAEDAPALLAKGLTVEEVLRVLVPNGVALLGVRAGPADELKAKLIAAGCKDAEVVNRSGAWVKARKPRPAEMDDWSHWHHGVDGNAVSKDTLVGVPASLKWIDTPTWPREHYRSTLGWASAGGRLFYVIDEAPPEVPGPSRYVLTARDAFNGAVLWKKPAGWIKPCSMVATADRLYLVMDQKQPLVAMDAATGEVVRTYQNCGSPDLVFHQNGSLILIQGENGGVGPLYCVDAASGQVKWQGTGGRSAVIGDGQIFNLHVGEPPYVLTSLDLATGAKRWEKPVAPWFADGKPTLCLCLYVDGMLILGDLRGNTIYGVSAKDGTHKWSYSYPLLRHGAVSTDIAAIDGLIWVHRGGGGAETHAGATGWDALDPATGEVKKRLKYPAAVTAAMPKRCHADRMTERFLITGSLAMIDWRAEKYYSVRVARGGCGRELYQEYRAGGGIVPANGLIYTPPSECRCYAWTNLRGFMALAPAEDKPAPASTAQNAEILEAGPAAGALPAAKAYGEDEWPTYRHDARRSGSTPAAPPAGYKPLWEAVLGGRPTSPAVAGGIAVAGTNQACQVRAFEAKSGKPLWTFMAGGGVDTPPTLHEGLCLFGANDGWIYCLRAADGVLIWRLRAALQERRIVAYGQLESAWPAYGTVLIQNGTAYFAAGHSNVLDGGITVGAAEPRTGKVLWRSHPAGDGLADMLVASSAGTISMRGWQFNAKTGASGKHAYEDKSYLKSSPEHSDGGFAFRGLLEGGNFSLRNSWWSESRNGGQVLVFDRETAYAARTWVGIYNDTKYTPGQGHMVNAVGGNRDDAKQKWTVKVPIRVTAMLVAGKTLLVAGPPDIALESGQDPWAVFEGRKGEGRLWALSTADGKKAGEWNLPASPVLDGLALAGGRLYVSTQDGRLVCLGAE